jgi:membrane protein implicated in regulation of membrane protease activity
MADWTALEKFYLTCGAVGGLLFLIRLGLLMVGIDHHGGDFDAHAGDVHGGDVHADAHDGAHNTDQGFKILTIQGMTAFFMMFGWVALAVSRSTGSSLILAFPAGFAAGGFAIYIMGWAMHAMVKMQSSGNIDIKNAIGQEGHVYLTIQKNGSGVVSIEVQKRLREMDAVASDKSEIKTGTRVRVVALEGAVLVVDRVV